MNVLILLYFVTSKQPKNKGYPQNPLKSVATTYTTHQECTSQDAPTIRTTLFLQTVENFISAHQSPSGPVYIRKAPSLSDATRGHSDEGSA